MKLLFMPTVSKLAGLHPNSIRRKVNDGSFPPPIHVGINRVGWIEEELDAWFEDRRKERDAAIAIKQKDRDAANTADAA